MEFRFTYNDHYNNFKDFAEGVLNLTIYEKLSSCYVCVIHSPSPEAVERLNKYIEDHGFVTEATK